MAKDYLPKHKKKTEIHVGAENKSIIYWIVMIFALGFIFIAPYQKALFNGYSFDFEHPINTVLLMSNFILLLMAIYFFYHWKLSNARDILSVFILLIPLSFLISSINGVSHHFSTNMVYYHVMFAFFFLVGANFTKSLLGLKVLKYGIYISFCFIVLFGFMNWFGDATFFGMFNWSTSTESKVYQDAVFGEPTNLRLTSVFQYPNTYAALLIALLLSLISGVLNSKKWYSILIFSTMLVPVCLSFFLTNSRGGFVTLPIILLIVLPFFTLYRQIFFIFYLLFSAALSFTILDKMAIIGKEVVESQTVSLAGWGILAIVSLINGLIITAAHIFITTKFEKDTHHPIKQRLYLPLVMLIGGTILGSIVLTNKEVLSFMPQNLYQRIEKINFQQHEVLERITFYKDSMKLFLDYPIFGAGGGAWAASYEQYQNNPYTSRQAHNFFVQYMAEVGLVGILILLTMIFIIMYLFIKQHIRNSKQDYLPFYIITVSLLIHSMLDFDMSYVYIEALVFLSLGTMLASVHFSKNILSEKIVNWQKIYPGFLLLLSIIMIFISIKVLNADSYYKKANAQIAANEPFQQIMNSLDLAIKNRPAHPEFLLLKARMLNSAYNQTKDEKFFEQALNIIQELKKSEPYNKSVFELEYAMLTNKKDYIAVLSLLEQKLSIYPWDNTIYDRAITIAFELGAQAKQNNDLQSEKQYWNKSIKYYEEVLQRIKLLELLPEGQNQGRPFTVLPSMALSIGQIYFANQNYDKASEVLKTNIDASLETDISKAISRYYIASLMRQGKQDQTVYDKLLSVDPNEKTEIESLINSN